MSGDYQCTHCGSRYDFHPGRCHNCGENTVSYLPQPTQRRTPNSPAVASQTSSAGSGLLGLVVVLIILGVLFG
ncbi:hypothetical protein [Steroidobacter sp.]|uniref:hypothetical protein n=1 Tax=Steroidobacter sp. TaxID=1978227 RepID=UPI0025CCEA28|nr:hypothetical protein [Steroidobacter sp.]